MSGPNARRVDPVEVFDALGIGWGVHELYPNPVAQQAFVSAVNRLSVLQDGSLTYEIGAGSVGCDGQELSIERGGTERLSLRLFVHEVEWLELVGAPTTHDLNEFLNLLAADEQSMRAGGGIASALAAREVYSISVTQRGLLAEELEKPWEERDGENESDTLDGGSRASRLARMITSGATAETVAEAMIEDADGDSGRIADSFCDAYRTVYPNAPEGTGSHDESVPQLLAAYRHAPKTRPPVDTFAETFFLMPVDVQARILADFLANRTEGLHSLLLDQFAGVELAELAPRLEEGSFNQLVDYARDVVESEVGSADDLLPMVSSARHVKQARKTAAERIREMIEGIGGLGGATGGLAGKLRAEIADDLELGMRVLRLLFEIEERSDRFGRMVDAWCGRISADVQNGRLEAAIGLLRIGRQDADLSPTKQRVVEAGLVELLRSDYAAFNEVAENPENRELLGELLGMFGEPAAVHLMERLSIEEDPATRRILIALLAVVGSTYPAPIVRFFKNDQWFVVRNAVTIAGKVGGEHWVPHLRPLIGHPDHRVVVEALRALTPLAPDEAVPGLVQSLAHENDRVRETALLLLKASPSPLLEAHLIRALTDRAMDGARREIAEALFDMGTPGALEVLQVLARKPFLISPIRRDARRAARQVLGSAA